MQESNPTHLNQELHRETRIYEQRPVIYPNLSSYQPPIPQQRVIIIEEGPVIPAFSHCVVCNQVTDTYETYRDGLFIWLMCMFLFLFTLCLFWVPFCIDDWKDVEYRCARCHHIKFVRKGGC